MGLLIPFVNLRHSINRELVLRRVAEVLDRGIYLYGPKLQQLEDRLSPMGDSIVVGSGTDALYLAARVLCEGRGVAITVANSAIATTSALVAAGMRVHFVDVDDRGLMDLSSLKEALTRFNKAGEMVKAVVPVDLYGQPVDIATINNIVKKLAPAAAVIEDMAQGYGMSNWKLQADAACLSFYPTKPVGALGDGGAILFNHSDWTRRARTLAFYGVPDREAGYQAEIGINSRMDEIQASVVLDQIEASGHLLAQRKDIARIYDQHIDERWRLPYHKDGNYYVYPVLSRNRDIVREIMKDKYGIGTAVHYPIPTHLQPTSEGHFDLPNTTRLCSSVLSLPIWPGMTMVEARYVARSFTDAVTVCNA